LTGYVVSGVHSPFARPSRWSSHRSSGRGMPDPRITHLVDQLGEDMRVLTPFLVGFYKDLVGQGMPPEQAIVLVERAMKRMGG